MARSSRQTVLCFTADDQSSRGPLLTAEAYLAAPPFLGSSSYDDKDSVKALGAAWYAGDKKRWGAPNKPCLARLLDSGKWTPTGLDSEAVLKLRALLETARAVPTHHVRVPRAEPVEQATDKERARLAALGVNQAVIDASPRWPELGPTSGLSPEARLGRWLDVLADTVRCEFEYDVHIYFSPTLLKPYQDARIAEQVAAWNRRAPMPITR